MPLLCYKEKQFNGKSRKLIALCNQIIADMAADGYSMTLRQLYYRLVAGGHILNNMKSYDRLGYLINDGRLAGLIDWDAIVDRTRYLRSRSHWENTGDAVSSAAHSFGHALWKDQKKALEFWVEKDALVDVVGQACAPRDVPFFSCRGNVSQSEMYAASNRLAGYISEGREPIIIHLGDHDPTGIDITRDIADRLEMFCDGAVQVKRIALNLDQVRKYNPPDNPAKVTDSRFESYRKRFGTSSWELDALHPKIITELINKEIDLHVDAKKMKAALAKQEAERAILLKVSRNWSRVKKTVSRWKGKNVK